MPKYLSGKNTQRKPIHRANSPYQTMGIRRIFTKMGQNLFARGSSWVICRLKRKNRVDGSQNRITENDIRRFPCSPYRFRNLVKPEMTSQMTQEVAWIHQTNRRNLLDGFARSYMTMQSSEPKGQIIESTTVFFFLSTISLTPKHTNKLSICKISNSTQPKQSLGGTNSGF